MKFLTLLFVSLLASLAVAQDCSFWDQPAQGDSTLKDYPNGNFHFPGGYHYLDAWRNGYCTYSDPNPGTGQTCVTSVDASDSPAIGDVGTPTGPTHVLKSSEAGSSDGNQGSISTLTSSGVVVAACWFGVCNLDVSITKEGVLTFSIKGGTEVWTGTDTYKAFCPAAVCSFCKIACTGNEECPGTECCLNNFCAPNQYCGGTARKQLRPGEKPDFDFLAMKDRLK